MQTQAMSKAPPAQSSILPPLQNLPSWSRSSLERRKQPRPIVRDPLPNTFDNNGEEFEMTQDQKTLNPPSNGLRTVSAPSSGEAEVDRRVIQMEKSLEFVQNEHAQVLENLHREIEMLKLQNKELNFKLIMSRSGVSLEEEQHPVPLEERNRTNISPVQELTKEKKMPNTETEPKHGKQMESQNMKRESTKANENKTNSRNSATSNLKKRTLSGKKGVSSTPPTSGKKAATQPNSSKSSFLSQARAKQLQKEKQELSSPPSANARSQSRTRKEPVRRTPQSPLWSSVHGGQKMLIVTLNKDKSMQVHVPTENGPRSPTLSECKTIIAEQQETNHKQAKELLKLRADLRDAITSQKWNQNTYLVGKSVRKAEANSSSSSAGTSQVNNRYLPRLPLREPVSGSRLQGRGPAASEKVTLPALRPNINSVVADRRRRQQAILRGRLGRRDFI